MVITQSIERHGVKATLSFEVAPEAILPSVGEKPADLATLDIYDEALWEAYSKIRLPAGVQDALAQAHQELFESLVSLGFQMLRDNYPTGNIADPETNKPAPHEHIGEGE